MEKAVIEPVSAALEAGAVTTRQTRRYIKITPQFSVHTSLSLVYTFR